MTTHYRLLLVAAAAAAWLAISAPAFAGFTPKVTVAHSPMALAKVVATEIRVTVPFSDPDVAKITTYAGLSYTANLAQPAGTTIGTFSESIYSRVYGQTISSQGSITAADPAADTQATIACRGNTTAGLAAVWHLNQTIAGQTVTTPVYVSRAVAPETAFATYKLEICEPSGYVPSSQGGFILGGHLLSLNLTVRGVFTTPVVTGTYMWENALTPYTPGASTPDPAHSVEARASVRLPVTLSLAGTYTSSTKTYNLSGKLTQANSALANRTVSVYSGTTSTSLAQISSTTTGSTGTYAKSGQLSPVQKTYFRTRASSGARDVTATGCTSPTFGVPCVSATIGPWTVWSTLISITP
jgi:hypothetical protein